MIGNKYNKGFTLIELMVSVAVFVLAVSAASGLFASSIKLQRNSIANQQLLAQTSYLTEYISRAVRMAKKDLTGACTGAAKLNYSFSNQCLKFSNYKDQCQQFCLVGSRITDGGVNYFTSNDLNVLLFNVNLSGQTQSDNVQPKIGISLEIQGKENFKVKIQTAVSQRSLDVKR
ncbi:MAG: prepilin-type N-terminal cleavage/methylation domain-containing protein [Candidatus Nealsonbacteria bacterium]|nr:prepilin-type N-terminal cleavage/methylation domain-containing protein [Candidatus Nealsonbacteria bacterium]